MYTYSMYMYVHTLCIPCPYVCTHTYVHTYNIHTYIFAALVTIYANDNDDKLCRSDAYC